MTDAWTGDWQYRLRTLAKNMGYVDIFDFVISHTGQSFGELFNLIRKASGGHGSEIAFVQLQHVYYDDAIKRGCLREAIMESMVRSIRQFMKQGWNRGKKTRERRIDARIHWPIPTGGYDEWSRLQDSVWAKLEAFPPPDDWCPQDRSDPIVQQIFSEAWPTGT